MPFSKAARIKLHEHRTDDWYREKLRTGSVVTERGCWEWQGWRHPVSGYGFISYHSKGWRVHRLSYFLFNGPIQPGHDVCHQCDVRRCCNPEHLWTGPRQLNNRDTTDKFRNRNSQKTHCPRGHAFAEHGKVYAWGYKGWRRCIVCQRARQRIASGWSEAEAYSMPPIPPDQKSQRRWNRTE